MDTRIKFDWMNDTNAFKDLDRYAEDGILQELNLSNGNINNLDNFDDIEKYTGTYCCSLRFGGLPIIYNKAHIDLRNGNNTRFPEDKDVRALITKHAQNYQELIIEIIDKIFKDYNCKNDMIKTLNRKIPEGIQNCPYYDYTTNDEYYKFAIYNTMKATDNTGQVRFFQIEAAIAIAMTFLTFDDIPLAYLKYEDWDDKIDIKHKRVISSLRSAIVQNTQSRESEEKEPLIELVKKQIFSKNRFIAQSSIDSKEVKLFLLPHPKIVLSPIFYIMGYSTWVKEVDSNFHYIPNNEINQPDKGDLYVSPKICGTLDDNHIFRSSFTDKPNEITKVPLKTIYKAINYEANRNK